MKMTQLSRAGGMAFASIILLSGCNSAEIERLVNEAGGAADNTQSAEKSSGEESSYKRDGAYCDVTESEQLMLDLVNRVRAEEHTCGDEVFPPAGALTWNCTLEQAALNHTVDMVDYNFFSHTGSDGLHAGDRITNAGYRWYTYGENLAAGFSTEEEAVDALLESPGHCRNLMNPTYTEFGSAVLFADNLEYISYWTQEFASPY